MREKRDEDGFYRKLLESGRGLTDTEMIKYIKHGREMVRRITVICAKINEGRDFDAFDYKGLRHLLAKLDKD